MADNAPLRGAASPLTGSIRVRRREAGRIIASYVVCPDETVLVGHFPGYPIFPGVCLVECAHWTATLGLAELVGDPVRLVGIASARFSSPVFPGAEVLIDVGITADPGGWTCRARLIVPPDVAAATVRLRYETAG
jgi:3-hydroxyacyl-[acyl-carrier-protein] dehydratase